MTTPTQLPLAQPNPLQPPPARHILRSHGPVHEVLTAVGHPAWLVIGYDEVRQLLADDRLGRGHPDPDNASRTGDSVLFGGPLGNFATEHADSARMRALLQPHFTPKRMRALRPRVDELTTRLLDDLAHADQPADLNEAVAVPLPILVICELLGVPYADRDRFRRWTHEVADVTDRERSMRGMASLFGYGQELVARKRVEPGDDVISRLCATEGLRDDEVAGLSMSLLFAGHETTVVQIGLGTLHLLANPDQWQALRADTGLIPQAVEEMLRAPNKGGSGGIPRYARTDLEIGDVKVRAGDLVLLDAGSANHDPEAFADPDRFDVTRGAVNHLSFGHGPHYCIGAPLARIELQAVFGQLVQRFPELRLAVSVDQLGIRDNVLTGGVTELPVRW